jgi:chloramphenicol-sensitive protein RarD
MVTLEPYWIAFPKNGTAGAALVLFPNRIAVRGRTFPGVSFDMALRSDYGEGPGQRRIAIRQRQSFELPAAAIQQPVIETYHMKSQATIQQPPQPSLGLTCAVTAYVIWGLTPIYFKALGSVPAFEILMHRIIWSFFFLLPLAAALKRGRRLLAVICSGRNLLILAGSTLLVGCNWFLFIWAINSDHILQTSLGYYINPLVNVSLGMLFLRERLRPLQVTAVFLAAAGVLNLTVFYGEFPWVALCLAFSFAFYGLIRKVAPVGALEGLTVETFLLCIPATAYLFYLDSLGQGAIFRVSARLDLLLAGSALVTAVPLLLFTLGARRLHLATMGFLQYIAPSCTFLLAVLVYGEPFLRPQAVTFAIIWLALALFSTDAVLFYRRRRVPLRR